MYVLESSQSTAIEEYSRNVLQELTDNFDSGLTEEYGFSLSNELLVLEGLVDLFAERCSATKVDNHNSLRT